MMGRTQLLLFFATVSWASSFQLAGKGGVTGFLGRRKAAQESTRLKGETHEFINPLNPGELTTHPGEEFRKQWEQIILSAQDKICNGISELEGGREFHEDVFQRPNNGGWGRTRVLQNGKVFEKGGVNVSIVKGHLPPGAARQMTSRGHTGLDPSRALEFYACGLSLVIHPHNPMAPTVHCNYRFFQLFDAETKQPLTWWFGGGTDLTPSYLFEEDAEYFHRTLKNVCDRHGEDKYPRFKRWCDEYFLIPHRGETRGVGGIFFDDFNEGGNPEVGKAFASECLDAFNEAYIPLVRKRMDSEFTPEQKEWQQLRRGRYVEFNLLYDRGTKFGLQTPDARYESILMSLPLTSRWEYQAPQGDVEGSWEQRTQQALKNPRDWIPIDDADLKNILERMNSRELQTA